MYALPLVSGIPKKPTNKGQENGCEEHWNCIREVKIPMPMDQIAYQPKGKGDP
jgi:hypothetical protein